MSITRRLVFIGYYGPALLFFPVGAFVTACRLAYISGCDYAVSLLAESIARKKGGAA